MSDDMRKVKFLWIDGNIELSFLSEPIGPNHTVKWANQQGEYHDFVSTGEVDEEGFEVFRQMPEPHQAP